MSTVLPITKREVLEAALRGEGPLGKAHDDEPVFVLRAQDAEAPDLVEKWAIRAKVGGTPQDKVHSANTVFEHMLRWHTRKHPD